RRRPVVGPRSVRSRLGAPGRRRRRIPAGRVAADVRTPRVSPLSSIPPRPVSARARCLGAPRARLPRDRARGRVPTLRSPVGTRRRRPLRDAQLPAPVRGRRGGQPEPRHAAAGRAGAPPRAPDARAPGGAPALARRHSQGALQRPDPVSLVARRVEGGAPRARPRPRVVGARAGCVRRPLASLAMAVGAIPLITPLLEEHHLTVALLPLLLAVARADELAGKREIACLVGAVVLLAGRYSLEAFPLFDRGLASLAHAGKPLG